jgi:murein DD-endopeptidase MepM/ murein hydrolase activator NlpD
MRLNNTSMEKRPLSRAKPSIFLYTLSLIIIGTIALVWFKAAHGNNSNQAAFNAADSAALESLIVSELEEQLNNNIAEHAAQLNVENIEADWQSVKIKPGQTISGIFKGAGLTAAQVNAVLANPKAKDILQNLTPESVLSLQITTEGKLVKLKYPLDKEKILIVEQHQDGYKTKTERVPLQKHIVQVSGKVESSMQQAIEDSGIPPKVMFQLAKVLSAKVDFSRDLRKGDTFRVIYPVYYRGEEKVETGSIIAAEFTNKNDTYQLIRYTDADNNVAYYDANGNSLERSFLRYPTNHKRISSHFSPNRKHPVLGYRRPHYGVDLAAKAGTPIVAAADGKITHRGRKGGYGNTVMLDHGNGYTTLYAHMSRFADGQRSGQRVSKGQIIGYVGSTGVATGPHLHYEFKINGKYQDPMKVALPGKASLAANEKIAFLVEANRWVHMLAQNASNTTPGEPTVLAMYQSDEGELVNIE